MDIFDTHAHLLDEHFDEDREALIASLSDAGVKLVMEACTDLKYLEKLIPFVEAWPMIYGAAGLHPEELGPYTLSDLTVVEAALDHPKIKAVGEIGLDYYWLENPPREVQRAFFDAQLSLAAAHRLPVIIHDREAHGDTVDVLRAHQGRVMGVMHCFSGSWETAKECMDLGFYLGFGGSLTFKNAKKNVEVAAKAPLDRLVIETDCPYMAPVPCRGQRNDPAKTRWVLKKLSEIRGMGEEELAPILFENGKKLFRI